MSEATRSPGILYRLAALCLAKPRATWLVGLLVTLLLASGLPLLELRTDGRAIYPKNNPIVERTEGDTETFRDPHQVIVLVSSRQGGMPVASAAGFQALKAIDLSLRDLPAIRGSGVRSLASLKDPSSRDGALPSVQEYLLEIPSDPAGIETLLTRIRSHPLTNGLFLSADGLAAAVYALLAPEFPREEAVADLERWLAGRRESAFDLRLTGPVIAEISLGRKVLRDLAWTTPVMLLAMTALLFACFKTRGAVVAVLAEVSAVLVCILGFMGWFGIPVTLVTTIMPVVLLVMAVADEVHFLERLQFYQGEPTAISFSERKALALQALREVQGPMILTSLATAAGFLAFPASDIVPLRDFGLLTAAGVLLAMLSSCTLIPALVVSLPLSWWRSKGTAASPPAAARPLSWLENWIGHRGRDRAALALGTGLVLLMVPGILRLSVQDSWIDNFQRSSAIARAHRTFNDQFWGAYQLDVVLSSPEEQFFRRPQGVKLIEKIVGVAATAPHAGGVISYFTTLQMLSDLTGKSTISELPADDLRTLNALGLLLRNHLDIDRFLTRDAGMARIRIHVKDADYGEGVKLQAYLQRKLAPLLAGQNVKVHFSGDLPIAVEVVRAITTHQLSSIAWSFVGILLLLTLAFRSLLSGLVVLAPVLAAAAVVLGAIGYLGIPLGVANSMFLALSIGSGIDFALHLVHSYGLASQSGLPHGEALRASFSAAGRSIRWNALVLGLGFLVLSLSSLKPNRTLGFLLGAAMLAAYFMTLLLLPRLLAWRDWRGKPMILERRT